jgi:hypothetical protein
MKNPNKLFDYQIIYPSGASGNFLKNFLDVEFRNIEASTNWVQDSYNTLYGSYIVSTHKRRFDAQHSIGIVPSNNDDLIKILINRFLKSGKIYQSIEFDTNSIEFLDKIFISIANELSSTNLNYIQNIYTSQDVLDGQLNVYSIDFDFCVYYNQIFDIEYLKRLYYSINGIPVDDFKLTFAKNYVNYHKNFYQTSFYKVLHQILKFEYENHLFKKIRTWDIGLFDLTNVELCNENLKKFLKKENYY